MNWIIWTIGWYLAVCITTLLDMHLEHKVKGDVLPITGQRLFVAFMHSLVWIIGMIKFW